MPEFLDRLDYSYRRPRFLDPSSPSKKPNATSEEIKSAGQEILDASYNSYKRVSDKANIILKAAEKVASKYTIPVPIESIEIRQAVIRQDPESNGDYITFALFVKMIEKIEQQAKRVDYAVIDTRVKGDENANQRKIAQKLNSDFDGLDDSLLALLSVGSGILILFLIHQIGGIWRGPEKVLAAHKDSIDQASPFIEGARETAIGLATAQVVLGIQQSLHYLFNNDGSSSSAVSQRITGSIGVLSQVDLPPLTKLFLKAISVDDHKTIVSYCIKYIAETTDRGYEFWYAYLYARKARYLAGRSLSTAPMFSEKEFAKQKLNFNTDAALTSTNLLNSNSPSSRKLNILDQITAEVAQGLLDSVVTPTDAFLCAKDYESSQLERSLNLLAQTLDTKFSRDTICCLVRFLGKLDRDLLRKIRILLSIVLNTNTIDLSATLQNFEAFFLNWVRDTVEALIMELVQALMDKIASVISDFLVDISLDIGDLSDCPLIVELVQSILDGLDYIIEDIENIIQKYLSKIQINIGIDIDFGSIPDRNRVGSPVLKIHKKRSLKNLLRIIDNLLAVLDKNLALCDDEEYTKYRSEGRNAITYSEFLESDQFTNSEDYLDIPEQIRKTYFRDAIEVRLPDGTILPSYDIAEVQLGLHSENPDICKTLYGSELVDRVLKKYRENANG